MSSKWSSQFRLRILAHPLISSASLANEAEEIKGWAHILRRNCEDHLEDMLLLAPWLALPVPSRGDRSDGGPEPLAPAAKAAGRLAHVAAARSEEALAQLDQ